MKIQNQQDNEWKPMLRQQQRIGGTPSVSTPPPPPTPAVAPTPPATSNSATTAQQQVDSDRIVAAQGLQSTVLTGTSNTNTSQGVQKKTLLGG